MFFLAKRTKKTIKNKEANIFSSAKGLGDVVEIVTEKTGTKVDCMKFIFMVVKLK